MINGTQLIASISAEAVERAGVIARQADVVAALTLEVLKGTSSAFDSGKLLDKKLYFVRHTERQTDRYLQRF
jgi:histidine ammonia-lyase